MGWQRQPCGGLVLVCGMFCCVACCISCGVGRSSAGGLLPGWTCQVLIGRGLIFYSALLAALLPGLASARRTCLCPACLCLARVWLARVSLSCLNARPAAREHTRRILRCGKGIVAIGHEQAGEPTALPERTDRVYERKSHEHSSQATSALLWLGQISSCPVASTTAMELVTVPKPLSVVLTRLAASTSAFLP